MKHRAHSWGAPVGLLAMMLAPLGCQTEPLESAARRVSVERDGPSVATTYRDSDGTARLRIMTNANGSTKQITARYGPDLARSLTLAYRFSGAASPTPGPRFLVSGAVTGASGAEPFDVFEGGTTQTKHYVVSAHANGMVFAQERVEHGSGWRVGFAVKRRTVDFDPTGEPTDAAEEEPLRVASLAPLQAASAPPDDDETVAVVTPESSATATGCSMIRTLTVAGETSATVDGVATEVGPASGVSLSTGVATRGNSLLLGVEDAAPIARAAPATSLIHPGSALLPELAACPSEFAGAGVGPGDLQCPSTQLVNTCTGLQLLASPRWTALVSFGDSLTDTGALTAIVPLVSFLNMDLPIRHGARLTDGRYWVEHVATALGFPLQAASAFGAESPTRSDGTRAPASEAERWASNYAVNGARAAADPVQRDLMPPLADQVGKFLENATRHRLALDPKSTVASVFIGANDVFFALKRIHDTCRRDADKPLRCTPNQDYTTGLAAGMGEVDRAIDAIETQVLRLRDAQKLNSFLVFLLPAIHETPWASESGMREPTRELTLRFNVRLNDAVVRIRARGVQVRTIDLPKLTKAAREGRVAGVPSTLRFETGCRFQRTPEEFCDAPSNAGRDGPKNYAYFDGVHPSSVLHGAIGRAALKQLTLF